MGGHSNIIINLRFNDDLQLGESLFQPFILSAKRYVERVQDRGL